MMEEIPNILAATAFYITCLLLWFAHHIHTGGGDL